MDLQPGGLCAVFEEPLGPAGVRVRSRPRPAVADDGLVTVAMRAAALNHLDLWVASGAQKVRPPRVIGAGGAGVVVDSGGSDLAVGAAVVVYPVFSCGACSACRLGEQVLCPDFGIVGEDGDGTAAEVIRAPRRLLFPAPHGLSFEEAAAFPLTFLTAWRMLTTRAGLKAGEALLVVGAGAGVATAAIRIGRHLGARVLATSRSESKRRQAIELGAEAAFPTEAFASEVRKATGGAGADVVFEHVGAATLAESLRAVRRGGRIVICGSTSGREATLSLPRVFLGQLSMLGSTMGNVSEFTALLSALEAGLRPHIDSVFPLAEVMPALERLASGEQFGKIVLSISTP